uniref:CSON012503 protein n=1 Tax=Culicoides sonorensis TaxID=179676 RepID=A0A336KQD8_CULSO
MCATNKANIALIYNTDSNKKLVNQLINQENASPADMKKVMRGTIKLIINYIKQIYHFYNYLNNLFLSSTFYKVLTRTTQPAHLVALLIATFVLSIVWPNLVASPTPVPDESYDSSKLSKKYTILMYLGVFATHFGAQMWMTFVSGLSLYFNLPRHIFGQCQQILFPRYFTLNSILSIIALITFIKAHDHQRWILSSYVQVIVLTLCAVIELTVRLYLAPPMLKLLHQKYRLESYEGVGKEIGRFEDHSMLEKNLCYKEIHMKFRKYHTIIATGNILTVVCTFVHLHYLASKIVAL